MAQEEGLKKRGRAKKDAAKGPRRSVRQSPTRRAPTRWPGGSRDRRQGKDDAKGPGIEAPRKRRRQRTRRDGVLHRRGASGGVQQIVADFPTEMVVGRRQFQRTRTGTRIQSRAGPRSSRQSIAPRRRILNGMHSICVVWGASWSCVHVHVCAGSLTVGSALQKLDCYFGGLALSSAARPPRLPCKVLALPVLPRRPARSTGVGHEAPIPVARHRGGVLLLRQSSFSQLLAARRLRQCCACLIPHTFPLAPPPATPPPALHRHHGRPLWQTPAGRPTSRRRPQRRHDYLRRATAAPPPPGCTAEGDHLCAGPGNA